MVLIVNERDLFKQIIEKNLIKKQQIHSGIINSIENKNRRVCISMNKRLVATFSIIAVLSTGSVSAYASVDAYQYNQASEFLVDLGIETDTLSRSATKKVYKDIQSDTFEYETTLDVLNSRAEELGIENIPKSGKELYDAIVNYHGLVSTGNITSEQIKSIKSELTYKEIIKFLGDTKDVGSGLHVLQYSVDGDKILYLSFADENDICTKSGEELLETLEASPQNHKDKNTFNATLTQRMDNSILVSCPTYDRFDVISLSISKDTIIEFEDGKKATIDDISYEMIVTIDDNIAESYPPQGTALKIIIKQ